MGTWRGATLPAAPAPSNPKHLHISGGPCVVPLPRTVPQGGRRAEPPGRGTPSPQHHTQYQPRPAYPGDAPAGRRAEPCPWMPRMKVGGSAWTGPHLLRPNPHLPWGLACSTCGPPPVHPWGACRASFALALQMVAGAQWGPRQSPSTGQAWGGWVRDPLRRRAGPEPPLQPLHLPAPADLPPPPPAPSFDLRRTRLLGKMTPNYHGNKTTGDGVGAGAMLAQPPDRPPQWRRVWRELSLASRWEHRGTAAPPFRASPGSIWHGP